MAEVLSEWVDFLVCSLNPDLINSKDRRLGLELNEWVGENKIFKIKQDTYIEKDDPFEAMRIDDFGGVIIWTEQKVWFVRKDRGLEKLLCVTRNPCEKTDF